MSKVLLACRSVLSPPPSRNVTPKSPTSSQTLPFVSAVNALDSAVPESFILQRKAACLFVQLVSESWLIVPDTGMSKEYNEGLFHSDGRPITASSQF